MKRRTFLTGLLLTFAAEAAVLLFFAFRDIDSTQDAVQVNEVFKSVQADWGMMEEHVNLTDLDYVVLDKSGAVLYRTRPDLSESIHTAVIHRDTILDVLVDDLTAGKIIIYNDSVQTFREYRQKMILIFSLCIILQGMACAVYFIYLNRIIVGPFQKLKGFAQRIAGGNLDIPLEMDRQNLFGAFTESFDIMRLELKRARIAEAEANESKKELVAKLSHDIKTPVASIKAASEVGMALTDNERLQDNYTQIIRKADQIDALITNLFTAALEELKKLPVMPADMESRELKELIENADYLHRTVVPEIPGCVLYADRLRLQQVLDNIFVNSYKYADTKIDTAVWKSSGRLFVSVQDYGGGVSEEDLPLIKEKFKRGSNTKNIEGAGLGLYIADYFMKEMHGELAAENEKEGFRVTVMLPLDSYDLRKF